jgi:hypothetical protein
MKLPRFQFRLRTLMIVVTAVALAQPLLIWAWDATLPRTQCSDILKPINISLSARCSPPPKAP